MTLTVAIPYYRGKDYLARAISSVRAQTVGDWRLLVCDDRGDPDPGSGQPSDWKTDGRVRYVLNPTTLGMAANWNRCFDLAGTDLVTLLHADDELQAGYVELMLRAAAAYPRAAALFCRARIIDERGEERFSFPDFAKRFLTPVRARPEVLAGERALALLLRGNFITCPTVCFRKSVVGGRRFDPSWRMVQDLAFYARLLLDGEHLVGLPVVAYSYRRHRANATTRYTEDLSRFREEVALYDSLKGQAAARGWRLAAGEASRKAMIKCHLGYRIVQDLLSLRVRQAIRKGSFLNAIMAG